MQRFYTFLLLTTFISREKTIVKKIVKMQRFCNIFAIDNFNFTRKKKSWKKSSKYPNFSWTGRFSGQYVIKSCISLTIFPADFLCAKQKTNVSISSAFILTRILTWSWLGFIMFEITETRSCLFKSFNSTSIPSQHWRPEHQSVNKCSDSYF